MKASDLGIIILDFHNENNWSFNLQDNDLANPAEGNLILTAIEYSLMSV